MHIQARRSCDFRIPGAKVPRAEHLSLSDVEHFILQESDSVKGEHHANVQDRGQEHEQTRANTTVRQQRPVLDSKTGVRDFDPWRLTMSTAYKSIQKVGQKEYLANVEM
jgi:hypothetical protein